MKAENGLKKCSKCGEVKKIEDFGIHRVRCDGLCHMCRICKSKVDKIYSLKVIERHAENNRKWRESVKDRLNSESKKITESLGDRYIKNKLSQRFSIPFKDIPPKMIELKRTQLINKRLIKNLKENETE